MARSGRTDKFGVNVLVAREEDLEAGFLQLAAQFEAERQGVGFLAARKEASDAIAGVLAAMAGVQTDGGDFFAGRFGRENQRADGLVHVQLGDESAFGQGKGQPHADAVEGGVGGVLVKDQARGLVGEHEFRAVVQACNRPEPLARAQAASAT